MYRFRYDDGTYKARSELEDIMSKVGCPLSVCSPRPAGGPCSLLLPTLVLPAVQRLWLTQTLLLLVGRETLLPSA